jgi:hypothetical protein
VFVSELGANFKENIITNAENLKNIGTFCKKISDITSQTYHYISHPAEIFKDAWIFTVNNSFSVCLLLTMGGMILYMFGVKKGSKVARISLFSYIAIQIFNTVSKRY